MNNSGRYRFYEGSIMDEDIELMLQVKSEQLSAYEVLYQRYQQPLTNFFYRLGCPVDNIEDCVQEVFLRIWKSRKVYEPTAKFTTFLFQIAKNYWINEADKKKRRGILQSLSFFNNSKEENDYEISDTSSIPDEQIQKKELQKKVQEAIASLKEKHRIVFVLSEIQGLKYKDIAEILNIPLGTVKSRMTLAEKQLRKKLQNYIEH